MTTKSKVPILLIQNMMLKRMISYLPVKDILILLVSIFPFIKSYPLQIAETKSLALKGNIDAQIQLGVFYNKGVEKDYLEAYYWMKMAANQGHPLACRYLGRAHLWGQGTSKNIDLAIEWFLQAANKGDNLAMFEIGKCEMIRNNPVQAAAWYKLSQEYGYDKASESFQSNSLNLNDSDTQICKKLIEKLKSTIIPESDSLSTPRKKNEKPIKRLVLKTGEEYFGHVINGVPNGFGKKKSKQGTNYQGEFKDGLEHGYGISFGIKGQITFQGNWIEGKPVLTRKKIKRDQSNF
jgi:hypothetical protein